MRLSGLKESRGQATFACLAIVIGALAVLHDGVPTSDLDLNDGGVWVTNNSQRLVAHLNYPSRTLDGGVLAPGAEFEVSQAANDVMLQDRSGSAVSTIDTAKVTLGSAASLPDGIQVVQGGNTVAVYDAAAGKVWTQEVQSVDGFSAEATPIVDGVEDLHVAVGLDGTAYVLGSKGKLQAVTDSGEGWDVTSLGTISGLSDDVDLSVVGTVPVVLDRGARTVRTLERTVELPDGDGLLLQAPGPSASTVAVTSDRSLVRATVAEDDGTATEAGGPVDASGVPVVPVRVGPCTYAVWGGTGHYVRACDDPTDDVSTDVPVLARAGELVFRINRDVVVLNDVVSGDVFLVNENMQKVANWSDILGQVEDQQQEDQEETDDVDQQYNPVRSQKNSPPKAHPDFYGVRPGRSTTLPVVSNDSDPDGDVLSAVVVDPPSFADVSLVRGGEALQVSVPSDARGSTDLTYEVSDGRGGSDTTTVHLEVHPPGTNEPPVRQDRDSRIVLGRGGQASYNLLNDWIDPDGDPIFLVSVASTDQVQSRSSEDGTVTVQDLGKGEPGLVPLNVVMSDGVSQASGTLDIDLRAEGNIPPTANADHAIVVVGENVVVKPLVNDTDPNGDELRLAQVTSPGGAATVLPDYATGSFSFTSRRPGTVYLEYATSDGPTSVKNVVRVDVIDPAGDVGPPTADNDLALLAPTQSTLVEVLRNDFDPGGGVLVVQSVSTQGQSRLVVDIVNHEFLRVSAPAGLERPEELTYTISNGLASASAQVTVFPVPPQTTDQPPVALDDVGMVRSGDVLTIPVLANDTSPAGLELSLDPHVEVLSDGVPGSAFIGDRAVRFKAGSKPGRVRITYTVRDSADNYTSAEAVVTVVELNDVNSSPTPAPLVARTIAGQSVRLAVPTDRVDPDGDSVSVLGLKKAPLKGTVTLVGNALEYTAPASSSGTDTFTYEVEDQFGGRGTASVRVGIAPPSATNQNPTALPDDLKVRPDRSLAVQVTANDIDADGDTPQLDPDSVQPTDERTAVRAGVKDGRVALTAPGRAADLQYYYSVSDGRGGTGQGVLTITVRPNAPLLAPVARDDVVDGAAVLDNNVAEVDVIDNDDDPDGDYSRLRVSSAEKGVSVAGSTLKVRITAHRRVVLYTVTDQDGLTSSAVVVVPGLDAQRPVIDVSKTPVKVVAGKTLRVPLADYVLVRSGHSPSLTFESQIAPGPGTTAEAVDQRTLAVSSEAAFAGATSVTFEVTDGENADDPDGLAAVLTLPIEVVAPPQDPDNPDPKSQHPPIFRPTPMTVAAGEPSRSADLRQMVTDSDPGDRDRLKFTLGSVGKGIDVRLSGSTLTASAPVDAAVGTTVLASVSVTDGSSDPVTAQVPIKVVASTRPLISVHDAVVNDAVAGKPVNVDVTDYATNPFARDGESLRLVGQAAVTVGQGQASTSGTTVTVTPAVGSHGQLIVRYAVGDATGEESREVVGQIRVTVRDRPEAPVIGLAETHASRTATVTWTAGANNGEPITDYLVRWHGASKHCGKVTSCTIDTLTNNVEYAFTVVAVNAVGKSLPSKPSNQVRPDVRPNAPGAPGVVFGDRSVDVSWTTPASEGSPVDRYTLVISPADAGGISQKVDITSTSLTWDNLSNGTAYQFSVIAHNQAEEPSDPSPQSQPVVPAGLPFAPTAPTVDKQPAGATQPSAVVSWAKPDGNGDDNLTYELKASDGRSWPNISGTSHEVLMDNSTDDVTFTVRATNKAGTGDWSGNSAPVRFFSAPGKVTNLKADETGANNTVRITFGAAPGNGAAASEVSYLYAVNGGTAHSIPAGGGNITSSDFPNGAQVTVAVWAVSTVRGESVPGDKSTDGANAFGPPGVPAVSASGNYHSVTLNWNANGTANGRAIQSVQIETTDGGVQGAAMSGSTNQGNGPSQTKSIRSRAQDSTGQWGPWSGWASATSWADSAYTFYNSGQVVTCPGTIPGPCYAVDVELWRYAPNSNVYCYAGGINAPDWSRTYRVDGNGYLPRTRTNAAVGSGFPMNQFGACAQR